MPATIELTRVDVENPEPHVVAIEVVIAESTVRDRVRSVYRKLSRDTHIPGFRKGHAPKEILRRHIGPERIRKQVTDELIPLAYDQAIKNHCIDPIERASVDVVEFAEDKPLTFKARMTVRPEVTLGPHECVEVVKQKRPVTDEQVQEQLERLQEAHAILEEVEGRGIHHGDVITGDLEVNVEGEKEARHRELGPVEIGHDRLVPSIDEHILGANVGEERTFRVTYPHDYSDPALRNQEASFTVRVTSIKQKHLPDLGDDFAKEVGEEFQDLAALEARVRERLREAADAEARLSARQAVLETVVNSSQVDIPRRLVEKRAQSRYQRLLGELTERDVTLNEYLKARDLTSEALEEQFRNEIENDLKRQFVLEAIARKEEIRADERDAQIELRALARELKQDPADLRRRMIENGTIELVTRAAQERKVIDWLFEHALVTYEEPSPEPDISQGDAEPMGQ